MLSSCSVPVFFSKTFTESGMLSQPLIQSFHVHRYGASVPVVCGRMIEVSQLQGTEIYRQRSWREMR
jgi:hypothetical protein